MAKSWTLLLKMQVLLWWERHKCVFMARDEILFVVFEFWHIQVAFNNKQDIFKEDFYGVTFLAQEKWRSLSDVLVILVTSQNSVSLKKRMTSILPLLFLSLFRSQKRVPVSSSRYTIYLAWTLQASGIKDEETIGGNNIFYEVSICFLSFKPITLDQATAMYHIFPACDTALLQDTFTSPGWGSAIIFFLSLRKVKTNNDMTSPKPKGS